MLNLIFASTRENGIGCGGKLPWPHIPTDMKDFETKTTGGTVIMGYNTMQSLPKKFLKGRFNIVCSKIHNTEIKETEDLKIVSSFYDSLKISKGKVFVIGGAQIYKIALESGLVQKIYHTQILNKFEADTFTPEINSKIYSLTNYSDVITENGVSFQFLEYSRKVFFRNPEMPYCDSEKQYLNLVDTVLQYGNIKDDRTGTGVKSLFGAQWRFQLTPIFPDPNDKEVFYILFPLLTTKKVFWRGVAEELFWIISGSTDTRILTKKGIHIWDNDTSRETLDKRGFKDRAIGDLAYGYGHQLRHYGAKYIDHETDYKGQGIDQLTNVIYKIKNTPNDRRILFCLWNPLDLDNSTLVPCHMFAQFYVTPGFNGSKGFLSCHIYIRSNDLALGAPFNIASYALMTCLIAMICGLYPGELIYSIGDAHAYINTIEGLQTQLTREPKEFPKLQINQGINDIEKFEFKDLKLIGYNPYEAIKMPLSF